MDTADITYDDAARWLPRHIRRDIEIAMPCRTGRPHDWQQYGIDVRTFDSLNATIYVHWQCSTCGLATDTDPADG